MNLPPTLMWILLALVGAGATGILAFVAVRWRIDLWLRSECIEEGPDFVAHGVGRKVIKYLALAVLGWIVLVMADALLLRQYGVLTQPIRKFSPAWIAGTITWPLWIGAFGGLLLGAWLGRTRGVCQSAKCKHIYPNWMKLFGPR